MAKILVVEDNPVNMRLATLLLHKAGHTVLCAVDAETGLALARTGSPDLILMDFQLPGMDGRTATALLKQDPATAAIPVIAFTATAMNAGLIRTAGCDAYIAKPLRYRELDAVINLHLARNAPPASSLRSPEKPLVAAAAAVGAVDVGVLGRLIGDDPALILDFLNEFQIGAAKLTPELKAACVAGQAMEAGRQAHSLKSSAYTVGATELGALCAEIEAAASKGSKDAMRALLPLFEQEIGAVYAFLDTYRTQHGDHRPGI